MMVRLVTAFDSKMADEIYLFLREEEIEPAVGEGDLTVGYAILVPGADFEKATACLCERIRNGE